MPSEPRPSHGFSLLELIITLGVLSLGVVGVAEFTQMSAERGKSTEQDAGFDSVTSVFSLALKNEFACTEGLKNQTFPTPMTSPATSATFKMGAASYTAGSKISGLTIVSIGLQDLGLNTGAGTLHFGQLVLTAKKDSNAVLKVRTFPFVVDVAPGPPATIVQCRNGLLMEEICTGIGGTFNVGPPPSCNLISPFTCPSGTVGRGLNEDNTLDCAAPNSLINLGPCPLGFSKIVDGVATCR